MVTSVVSAVACVCNRHVTVAWGLPAVTCVCVCVFVASHMIVNQRIDSHHLKTSGPSRRFQLLNAKGAFRHLLGCRSGLGRVDGAHKLPQLALHRLQVRGGEGGGPLVQARAVGGEAGGGPREKLQYGGSDRSGLGCLGRWRWWGEGVKEGGWGEGPWIK